jgi:drug/metabolite transporter (DMT)-like permease
VWTGTPLALLPWQFTVALLPLLLVALITEGIPNIEWTGELVAIVIYQGVVASGFAVWGRLTVLRSLPAISTNLAMLAVPMVGLISSVIVVDEELTAGVVVGLALVVAGVAASLIADSRAAGAG